MSLARNNKRKQKALKAREKKDNRLKTKIVFGLIIFFIITILIGPKLIVYLNSPKVVELQKIEQSEGGVPLNLVCMVFDSYKGVEQIPVEVDSVTYYGCCQGCIKKLKNNENGIRFSVDPFSKRKVDKAKAYAVIKPKSKSSILYFESEENYTNYINNLQ